MLIDDAFNRLEKINPHHFELRRSLNGYSCEWTKEILDEWTPTKMHVYPYKTAVEAINSACDLMEKNK